MHWCRVQRVWERALRVVQLCPFCVTEYDDWIGETTVKPLIGLHERFKLATAPCAQTIGQNLCMEPDSEVVFSPSPTAHGINIRFRRTDIWGLKMYSSFYVIYTWQIRNRSAHRGMTRNPLYCRYQCEIMWSAILEPTCANPGTKHCTLKKGPVPSKMMTLGQCSAGIMSAIYAKEKRKYRSRDVERLPLNIALFQLHSRHSSALFRTQTLSWSRPVTSDTVTLDKDVCCRSDPIGPSMAHSSAKTTPAMPLKTCPVHSVRALLYL